MGYRDIHTHRRSYEQDGRDQGDPSVGQRTPTTASNYQNPGKGHGMVSPSQTLREPTSLILDFRLLASRTGRQYISVV